MIRLDREDIRSLVIQRIIHIIEGPRDSWFFSHFSGFYVKSSCVIRESLEAFVSITWTNVYDMLARSC